MQLSTLKTAQELIKGCTGFNSIKEPKGILIPCTSSLDFQVFTNSSGKKMFVYIFDTKSFFEAQF